MSEQRTETEGLTYSDWANSLRNGNLVGQECSDCGNVTGAPKSACPECGSRDVSSVHLPENGTVYTETTVAVPPEGFDDDSYKIGIVQVGDGRVLGRLDNEAEIGDEVEFVDVLEATEDPSPVFEKK